MRLFSRRTAGKKLDAEWPYCQLSGSKILAEATSDVFWATGLFKPDTLRTAPKHWPGRNTLGLLLDALRAQILAGDLDKESESDVKTEDEAYVCSPDLDEDTTEPESWADASENLPDLSSMKPNPPWSTTSDSDTGMQNVYRYPSGQLYQDQYNYKSWPESYDEDYHCPDDTTSASGDPQSDVLSSSCTEQLDEQSCNIPMNTNESKEDDSSTNNTEKIQSAQGVQYEDSTSLTLPPMYGENVEQTVGVVSLQSNENQCVQDKTLTSYIGTCSNDESDGAQLHETTLLEQVNG